METLLRQCKCILMQNITKIYSRNASYVTNKISTKQLYNISRLNRKYDIKRWYYCALGRNKCAANSQLFYGKNNAASSSVWKQMRSDKTQDKKETLLNADKHMDRKVLFENVIEQNKEKFRETEQRLRAKSNVIIKDIKATKDKMKVRMEEVIEVFKNKKNVTRVLNLFYV